MASGMKLGLLFSLLMVTQLYAKDLDIYCGACHMLVDEVSWGISQTDPKRTIQVGSFRIMPDGSQRLNEIPYKQSEVQVSELLDTACGITNEYYKTTDKSSSRDFYKRQNRRDGQPSALKDLSISKEMNKMLRFACEGVAEDFEEEILQAFKNKEDKNYLKTVCVDIAGVCTADRLYDVNPDVAPAEDADGDDDDDDDDTDSETTEDDEQSNSDSDHDVDEGSNKRKIEL